MRPTLRIAALVRRDTPVAEALLRGVYDYASKLRPWTVRLEAPDPARADLVAGWSPDGVLAQIDSPALDQAYRKLPCPVVNVGNRFAAPRWHEARFDDRAVGRLAAEHFLERGYKHFGFVGVTRRERGRLRLEGFERELARHGHACRALRIDRHPHLDNRDNLWRLPDPARVAFLTELPRPCAVLHDNDRQARIHAEVCRMHGIAVPEEMALLGVSDDELECELADPPISSIRLPAQAVGRQAAELLDHLMTHPGGRPVKLRLPPRGVTLRASTDIVAIDDALVAGSLRFIRGSVGKPIGVDDVLAEAGVSRRLLEQRFRKALGRTPLQEIHRTRIDRACRLLRTTSLSMGQIAQACGFRGPERLAVRFRAIKGSTPRDYRRQARVEAASAELA
ncbi:MAG: substrate-binding domain-containing protein [Planctomycetota bacterium]